MLLGHPSLDIYDICRIRKYSDSKSCFISWIWRHHLTTSPRFSSISAMPRKGKAGSTVVSAVVLLRLRECPVHQIPRNGKISMFQRGHVGRSVLQPCRSCSKMFAIFKKIYCKTKSCQWLSCPCRLRNVLMILKVTTVAKPFQRSSPLLYIYGGFYKWRCTPKTLDGLFPGKSHLEMDEYPYFRKPPYSSSRVFVQDFF